MFQILRRRHPTTPPTGWIIASPDGHFMSLTKRLYNAARITDLRDAQEVARACTGDGKHGKWTVYPAPPLVGDPRE